MRSRATRRLAPDAYVSVDYQKRYGLIARRGENLDRVAKVADQGRSAVGPLGTGDPQGHCSG